MPEFADLQDLKAHVNVTRTDHDSELSLMLEAAEDVVRSLVGSFTATSVTERIPVADGVGLLSRSPVGGVSLVGGDGAALTGHTVNEAARLLYDVSTYSGFVTATYTAGNGQVPAAVRLATVIIAAHLWETQRGTAPSPLAAQAGDVGVPFPGGAGFAIPNRARDLLEPYVRSAPQVA